MKKFYKIAFLVLLLFANLSLWAQNADYYRAAANRGDKVAQHNLGACYYNGTGVVQDYKQAVYWFKKAAEQGNENAKDHIPGAFACDSASGAFRVPRDHGPERGGPGGRQQGASVPG